MLKKILQLCNCVLIMGALSFSVVSAGGVWSAFFMDFDLPSEDIKIKIPKREGGMYEVTAVPDARKLVLMAHQQLTGPFPQAILRLKSLEKLEFCSNPFAGEIPQALWTLPCLRDVYFTDSYLYGRTLAQCKKVRINVFFEADDHGSGRCVLRIKDPPGCLPFFHKSIAQQAEMIAEVSNYAIDMVLEFICLDNARLTITSGKNGPRRFEISGENNQCFTEIEAALEALPQMTIQEFEAEALRTKKRPNVLIYRPIGPKNARQSALS